MSESIQAGNETATIAPQVPRLAYSMSEAAQALGISYQSIWRLIRRGLLKTSGGLRHKLISLAELQRYLAETT